MELRHFYSAARELLAQPGRKQRQGPRGRSERTQLIGEMILEFAGSPLGPALRSEYGLAARLGSLGAVVSSQCSDTDFFLRWKALERHFPLAFFFPLWLLTELGIMLKHVAVTRKLFQLLIAITRLLINTYDYVPLSLKGLLGFNI